MFWSGNFMAVRELNCLLKEENVTLASVLEADDILQECKADNKALIQFLTRPDILAELITLITEEPPKNVELSQQYRHASIACEVVTSHLSTLSDRLTLDTAQMNRLCDFINKDPPLNPLLASYFSKTVEMLLERSPKQDWYLYHIVCLRVLDFFKSRRDFLPNLLRHISTSAIADTFKYFIRLEDLFNKPIMEWLEEHQFIDSLIQIICGTYVPEHFPSAEEPEKGQREASEKELAQDTGNGSRVNGPQESARGSAEAPPSSRNPASEEESAEERRARADRAAAVAAANAAALLCDLVATGCAGEGCSARSRTAWQLGARVGGCACVRYALGLAFTCSPRHRAMALHHAADLLQTLLHHRTSENEEERCGVELAVAPHLPLLHQALLHDPTHYEQEEGARRAGDGAGAARVGAARVSTAALLAQLALSEVEEVAGTVLTLGTPEVLVALMFEFPDNNFLHAQVLAFCRHALNNRLYRTQYATHLFVECDLLTRLMDAFEENEHKKYGCARAGYMGHVILLLGCVSTALEELEELLRLAPALLERWRSFREQRLCPVLLMHDTPLGGTYPSDNIYEVGEELDNISDTMAANYDFSEIAATTNLDDLGDDLASDHEMRNVEEHPDSAQLIADGRGRGRGLEDAGDERAKAQNSFLELASQRFDDDMWDEVPQTEEFVAGGAGAGAELDDVTQAWAVPAWERASGGAEACPGGEGWAQFDAFAAPYWPEDAQRPESSRASLEADMLALRLQTGAALEEACTVELANNLLTAMSAMTPDAIANIVNANLQPLPPLPLQPLHPAEVPLPSETNEATAPNPVTPPAEFSNPPAVSPSETSHLPGEATLPAEAKLDAETTLPAEATLPAETTLPVEAKLPAEVSPSEPPANDAPESGHLQNKTVEINCVTPVKETPVESKCSTAADNVNNTDGKVDDLSPQDKLSTAAIANKASAALDNGIAVADSPLEVTDTSER